jgi:thiosulfate/3-mercaptopyruvate sulfurtransferase
MRAPYLLAAAMCGLAFVSTAAADAPIIVDTVFVEAAAERGAILWDVRAEDEYKKGHIPGAVNMDDPQVELRDATTEDYLPIEQIEKRLGETGIALDREIVVYGAKASPNVYFAYQTLRYLGADRAHVYHSGFEDWRVAGKSVSTERTTLPVVGVTARPRRDRVVSTEEVLAQLNNPGVQIVDARTVKEFSGEDIRALRGGHIPGAVNIPYEHNWIDPETPRKLQRRQVSNKDGMALKSEEALRQLYAGLDPDKSTIVYCHSGSRASETAAVLEQLRFRDVKIYDSSWLGWGNRFNAPVENLSYFNVARVNNLLNQLQGRIDALEAEVAQLKAAGKKQ